jgi:hypothetical protein
MNKDDNKNKLEIDYKAQGIWLKVEQLFVDEHYSDM